MVFNIGNDNIKNKTSTLIEKNRNTDSVYNETNRNQLFLAELQRLENQFMPRFRAYRLKLANCYEGIIKLFRAYSSIVQFEDELLRSPS